MLTYLFIPVSARGIHLLLKRLARKTGPAWAFWSSIATDPQHDDKAWMSGSQRSYVKSPEKPWPSEKLSRIYKNLEVRNKQRKNKWQPELTHGSEQFEYSVLDKPGLLKLLQMLVKVLNKGDTTGVERGHYGIKLSQLKQNKANERGKKAARINKTCIGATLTVENYQEILYY